MKFIAVDWGSSSFRAYLIDDCFRIAEQIENKHGILQHLNKDFEHTLMSACGEWIKHWPKLPIIMSGMVGSLSGWKEAPYMPCPADNNHLAQNLTSIQTSSGKTAYIVPGVSGSSANGYPDVMRGEEVQIFGALELTKKSEALICLPGTHSKWAKIENHCIQQFSTFFSGETFSLLEQHSSIGAILNESSDQKFNNEAFTEGVRYSRTQGGLLHHIFSARAKYLTQPNASGSLRDYLSGIIIGHEFSGAANLYAAKTPVLIVGSTQLTELYSTVASMYDIEVASIDAEQAVVAGLQTIVHGLL